MSWWRKSVPSYIYEWIKGPGLLYPHDFYDGLDRYIGKLCANDNRWMLKRPHLAWHDDGRSEKCERNWLIIQFRFFIVEWLIQEKEIKMQEIPCETRSSLVNLQDFLQSLSSSPSSKVNRRCSHSNKPNWWKNESLSFQVFVLHFLLEMRIYWFFSSRFCAFCQLYVWVCLNSCLACH